jgi:uncharacterized membrane protein YdbT with pleckstrin-like domain
MVNKGIIRRIDSVMPITKVNDMNFKSTIFGQLLGYGTLAVELAGQKYGLEIIEDLNAVLTRDQQSAEVARQLRREGRVVVHGRPPVPREQPDKS